MFARTPRLTLRPAWPEEAGALQDAIAHWPVVANLARVPWPYTVEDARVWLARPDGGPDDVFRVIVAHDGAEPRLVGGIGIHPASGVVPDQDAHEIGYWLTPSAWGRGYMTEAVRAMVDHARDGLRMARLSATHFLDNPASGRVMRKLGFQATGRVVTMASRARGGLVQAAVYELDLCADRARLAA